MSSAGKHHFTFSIFLAAIALAAPAMAADASGTPTSAASAMQGVVAGSETTAPAPAFTAAPKPASAYAPPNAAQLIQLLAPVAVFPDALVAEVLAAATYPDQVVAVDAWLAQNRTLSGAPLQQALAQQSWDDGVKALAQFPDVVHQMATNPQWTAALGEAYINDPVDVMNAVQALRQKAVANGNLKSSKYLTVTSAPNDMAKLPADATSDPDDPSVYDGPAVVPPPERIVEIAPADPDDVYVPYYDPGVFYGTSFGVWPGYAYAWPAPLYYGPAFGAFAFGTGIAIDVGFGRPWGWHSWHTRWGPGYYGHGWRGPSVVHDNQPYVDHSDRIVNHFAPRDAVGYRRPVIPPRSAENLANVPSRAGIDSSSPRGTENLGSRVAPANYAQMPMPHFAGAMAQRGNGIAARADAATAPRVSAHDAALASSRYAPQRTAAPMRDPAPSRNAYGRDASATRPYSYSPPSYRGDQGHVRGTPMQSRVMLQNPQPSQRNGAPESFRGNDAQGRGNDSGGRSAPSRGAVGGAGGGRAGGAGHH